MQYWTYLITAIMLEVAGTTAMKLSGGFTRVWPSVAMMLFYLLSLGALTLALKRFDMSMAYAIWSGVGTALITLVGVWMFKEPVTLLKLASIALIIAGVVGLHLSGEG
jgi:small multidrug resistance pump